MKISNKITNIFNNLTDYELKQILQLMIDQKPEESGLLLLQENGLINKPVETTNEQPKTFTFEEIYEIEITLKNNLRTRKYIERVKEILLKS